jgi:hypothetical protein
MNLHAAFYPFGLKAQGSEKLPSLGIFFRRGIAQTPRAPGRNQAAGPPGRLAVDDKGKFGPVAGKIEREGVKGHAIFPLPEN